MAVENNPNNETKTRPLGNLVQINEGREIQEDEEICFLCDAAITAGMAYAGNRHICMDCAEGEERSEK